MIIKYVCYFQNKAHAGVVQPGSRCLPVTEEITGSNPVARA